MNRLDAIKKSRKKFSGIVYKKPDNSEEFGIAIQDATEDFDWMIYEINRLERLCDHQQEFIENVKSSITGL
jgi:hypothetical protein